MENNTIKNFIAQIASKDYASAQTALQAVVAEKIKNKVRDYISAEKSNKENK